MLRTTRFWTLALLTTTGATVGWGIMGAFAWPDLVPLDRLKAGLHHIVAATDVPLVQLSLAAVTGLVSLRFASSANVDSLPEAEPGEISAVASGTTTV